MMHYATPGRAILPSPALVAVAPALFVVLWSTGFIGMRFGAPYAEPFTFMLVRMMVVVLLLLMLAFAARAPWPRSPREVMYAVVTGLLVHATYLNGVLYAIKMKLPLGFIALIAGLQPLLTALFAHSFLNERLSGRQWAGLILGLAGVTVVVGSKYNLYRVDWLALCPAAIGLLGITFGTLYQKRYCSQMDLRTGGVIQYTATGVALLPLAFFFETMYIDWTMQFVFALVWLSVVLSIGAIGLLYFMIRRGAASKVVSLFFLTPSVTAAMAFILFGEALPLAAIGGFSLSAAGVALVMRR